MNFRIFCDPPTNQRQYDAVYAVGITPHPWAQNRLVFLWKDIDDARAHVGLLQEAGVTNVRVNFQGGMVSHEPVNFVHNL